MMSKPDTKAHDVPEGAELVPAVSSAAVELVVQPTPVVAAPAPVSSSYNLDDAVAAKSTTGETEAPPPTEGPAPNMLCGADVLCAT